MGTFRRHLPSDTSIVSLHVSLNRIWDAIEANTSGVSTPPPASILGSPVASVLLQSASPAPGLPTGIVTAHNALSGIQGGDVDNYYHLTSSEYTGTGTGPFVRSFSPALDGIPTAPTAPVDDNSITLATTAYMLGQKGTSTPLMDGTGSAGVSNRWTPIDHVHPTDTTLQPLSTILTTLSALTDATGWLHNDGAGVLSYSTPPLTTWATITGIPTLLSTLGALANTAGYLQNDGSGGLSWAAGTSGASWGTITGSAPQAAPSGGFAGTLNAQDAIFRGIIQIGKAGVGGNAAYYNDTGTLSWQQGIMNSPGAVNWSLYDLVNARSIITADASTGAVTLFGALSAGVITGTSFNAITGLATVAPLINGTAAVGTSTLAARQDHIHPTDTSRQASLSGTGFVKISGTTISYDNSTYYLASNPSGYTTNLGTVTSVAALTLGTAGTDLSSTVATGTTTPVITLNVPTASASNRGALSSADWSAFNGKQSALGFTPINKAGDTGIGSLTSTGTIAAVLFSGSGASLTNLQWGQLTGSSPQASPAGGWSTAAQFNARATVSAPSSAYGGLQIVNLSPGEASIHYSDSNGNTTELGWTVGKGTNGIGDTFGWYWNGANRASLTTSGVFTATQFSGSGSGLTSLQWGQLTGSSPQASPAGGWSTGATFSGPVSINPGVAGNYNEGLRISKAADGYAGLFLGTDTSGSGAITGQFSLLANSSGNFDIRHGGSTIFTLDQSGNSTQTGYATATTLSTSTPLVSGLPAGAAGMHSFVTNALAPTFGATVVGGGAVGVPVYHDGVSWKVG